MLAISAELYRMSRYMSCMSQLPPLRMLVFPETGGRWTARSLEHDIAVQARSFENAVDALVKVVKAHIEFDVRHNRPPLSAFPPAPRVYWNAFRSVTRMSPPREIDVCFAEGLPQLLVAVVDQSPETYRLVTLTA